MGAPSIAEDAEQFLWKESFRRELPELAWMTADVLGRVLHQCIEVLSADKCSEVLTSAYKTLASLPPMQPFLGCKGVENKPNGGVCIAWSPLIIRCWECYQDLEEQLVNLRTCACCGGSGMDGGYSVFSTPMILTFTPVDSVLAYFCRECIIAKAQELGSKKEV